MRSGISTIGWPWGEHGEGEELWSEHPLSDGSDTDLSEEAKTLDNGEGAIVGAAEGDAIVSVIEGGSTQLNELKAYDQLIEAAKRLISNPRTAHLLAIQRKELERSLRGVDDAALKAMDKERSASLDELARHRAALREVENEQLAQKKIEDAAKKEKDKEQKEKKALKAQLEHNKLLVDKKWDVTDFGSISHSDQLEKCQLTKQHKENIRECMMRTPIAWKLIPLVATFQIQKICW